jgi:hypothetical protein
MTDIDLSDLRQTLDAIAADLTLQDDTQHARRLVLITALLSEAFRRYECRTTLVGGGAIEFYAPGAYETEDIDLVVEGLGKSSARLVLDPVFAALGFKKLPARHWAARMYSSRYLAVCWKIRSKRLRWGPIDCASW